MKVSYKLKAICTDKLYLLLIKNWKVILFNIFITSFILYLKEKILNQHSRENIISNWRLNILNFRIYFLYEKILFKNWHHTYMHTKYFSFKDTLYRLISHFKRRAKKLISPNIVRFHIEIVLFLFFVFSEQKQFWKKLRALYTINACICLLNSML